MKKFFTKCGTYILILVLINAFNTKSFAQLFGTKFKSYILVAPEKPLKNIKKIAVLNFDNKTSNYNKRSGTDLGTKLADYIITELLDKHRGAADKDKIYMKDVRTNIFEIVERNQLDKILKEQNIQISGFIDDEKAVEIGKLLGIDAIILGSLSYNYKDERKSSSYKNKKTGKTTTYYNLYRTLNAESRMKIISVETAQILGTISPKTTVKDSKTSTKGWPSSSSLKPVEELADESFRQLAKTMVNYFSPYFSYHSFTLRKIKVREYKKRAKEANKYMQRGEINSAFKLYKAIYDEDNYNAKVAYNLGVIYEVVGDFDNAYEFYSTAYQLDESNKIYFKAYKRAEKDKELIKELSAIGINIGKYEFLEGGSDVLAEKIITRGSKSKRVFAYEKPDRNSKIIAKVPGHTSFKIINKKGDWYFVKLLGGKKGYFHKYDVKED